MQPLTLFEPVLSDYKYTIIPKLTVNEKMHKRCMFKNDLLCYMKS